jgi:hypothetical protein
MTTDQRRDLRDAIDANLNGKPVQSVDPNECNARWRDTDHPTFSSDLLWRPKPKTRPWNCPADVPMPVCWLRRIGQSDVSAVVVSVSTRGFEYSIRHDRFVPWSYTAKIVELEYSTDGRDWRKCEIVE